MNTCPCVSLACPLTSCWLARRGGASAFSAATKSGHFPLTPRRQRLSLGAGRGTEITASSHIRQWFDEAAEKEAAVVWLWGAGVSQVNVREKSFLSHTVVETRKCHDFQKIRAAELVSSKRESSWVSLIFDASKWSFGTAKTDPASQGISASSRCMISSNSTILYQIDNNWVFWLKTW